jgi:hypothetical protein
MADCAVVSISPEAKLTDPESELPVLCLRLHQMLHLIGIWHVQVHFPVPEAKVFVLRFTTRALGMSDFT